MEADVTEAKKTRERTEGAPAAVQAKHGDSCSAKSRDYVLVDIGAAAPKPCLSPVEMRTLTTAGRLLPTGRTSTATMAIFHQLPLWFCLTKEIKSRTPQYALDRYIQQFLKVGGLRNKVRANSGVQSRRLYRSFMRLPVFGSVARVALWGGSSFGHWMVSEGTAFFGRWMARSHHLAGEVQANRLHHTYCGRSLFLRSQAGLKMSCRQRRHKAIGAMGVSGCKGTPWWSEQLDGKKLHGALGDECDLKPRESVISWTASTESQPIFQHLLQVCYYADF